METAAYRVMEDIENYNRLGGLENHLFDTIMQIIMMDQIMARHNRAITALIKLQSHGITDKKS
jgi:phosphate uptake regulator